MIPGGECLENLDKHLGKKVKKKSNKPFKSKLKINTVKDVISHPKLPGKYAYTFKEDDSYVSVVMCEIVKTEE